MANTENYADIADHFPAHIPFPKIERLHKSGACVFADVKAVGDLPSRLIFGDIVFDSFMRSAEGWSVRYADTFGNGLDLSVTGNRFEAKPRFLGSEGLSVGPANHRQAFGELLNLSADQWNRALKASLEARYPVQVAPGDHEQPHAMFIPDGWMKSILVPVSSDRLGDLLNWYNALATDSRLGASISGAVHLVFNAVNYLEGKCPTGWDDPAQLLVRTLITCNTPIEQQVVREEANDGSAAWTSRRSAYLFRLTAFLRDIPHLVDSLSNAGFISDEPDLCTAIAPAEMVMACNELRWWSPGKECRITWVTEPVPPEQFILDTEVTPAETLELVQQGMAVGTRHTRFFGLDEEI